MSFAKQRAPRPQCWQVGSAAVAVTALVLVAAAWSSSGVDGSDNGVVVAASGVSPLRMLAHTHREEISWQQQRSSRRRIPRVVHQTWKTNVRGYLPAWAKFHSRTWEAKNPGWRHVLWSDDDITAHIAAHHPELVPASQEMQPVQRADLFRYMILYDVGGVYADLDVACVVPIDRWAKTYGRAHHVSGDPGLIVGFEQISSERADWAEWYAREFQFSQWTIAAQPGHPVLRGVLDLIRRFFAGDKALRETARGNFTTADVLESTGPGIWTDAVVNYMHEQYGVVLRDDSAKDGGKLRVDMRGIALQSRSAQRDPHAAIRDSAIALPALDALLPNSTASTASTESWLRTPSTRGGESQRSLSLLLSAAPASAPQGECDVLVLPQRAFGMGGGGVRIEHGHHPAQDMQRDVLVTHHFQGSWKAGSMHSGTGKSLSWREEQGRAPAPGQEEAGWAKGACKAWRQTGGCRGDGPREKERDGQCDRQVQRGTSGFCDCDRGDNQTYRVLFGCEHPLLTCIDTCADEGAAVNGTLVRTSKLR